MSTSTGAESPELSYQLRRADTIELDRLEGGGLATPVPSNSNTEGSNETLPGDADGGVFQQIRTQAPRTFQDHRNDESEESQARAPEINLFSGSLSFDNTSRSNGNHNAEENGTREDLVARAYPEATFSEKSFIPSPDQLPPEVQRYKKSLKLALQLFAL
ncbi:hypothetical protein PM082_018215 [Marasmius tenuissimus]|nr:hypothetical protein PM082_018215 [Marasmius tenuissimus]